MQGESPTYILNEDTQPVRRAIGVSHTACKDEFRPKYSISQLERIFIFMMYIYIYWYTYEGHGDGFLSIGLFTLFVFLETGSWVGGKRASDIYKRLEKKKSCPMLPNEACVLGCVFRRIACYVRGGAKIFFYPEASHFQGALVYSFTP